jgi:hypothetical protein
VLHLVLDDLSLRNLLLKYIPSMRCSLHFIGTQCCNGCSRRRSFEELSQGNLCQVRCRVGFVVTYCRYPNLQFRAVGCDLGTEGYMNQIIKATEDITINLLFNNAGYVLIGVRIFSLNVLISFISCSLILQLKEY